MNTKEEMEELDRIEYERLTIKCGMKPEEAKAKVAKGRAQMNVMLKSLARNVEAEQRDQPEKTD